MNLLINFSTLKAGGGQNVAMNFLYEIFKWNYIQYNIHYFVAQDSLPHKFLKEKNYEFYYVVPKNAIKRIFFEIFKSNKILKNWQIDIIYSYFGFGLFPKKYKQIVGSADSNLYFPEIDFWKDYKGLNRLKKYLIDLYRVYGIKRADAVVFENIILENRAKKIYNLKNTITIKPSINVVNTNKNFIFKEKKLNNSKIPKGLFLCGWHLNKNIFKIPEIAFYMKELNFKFQFILTAPLDNSEIHQKFIELVKKYKVEDMCFVIGQVVKEDLSSLYKKIDYVFLLSKLESFSNNIIEAWYFNKLLIISDEEWSKSICKNAALYVDRDNAKLIANKIINLSKNEKSHIIKNGKIEINSYPTIQERINLEMEYLKNVKENF